MSTHTPQFRPLNENEKSAIQMAVFKKRIPSGDLRATYIGDLAISYETMQGGFTIAILYLPSVQYDYYYSDGSDDVGRLIKEPRWTKPTLYRGASRRSYKDRRSTIRGEMLAFKRAIICSRPTLIGM